MILVMAIVGGSGYYGLTQVTDKVAYLSDQVAKTKKLVDETVI